MKIITCKLFSGLHIFLMLALAFKSQAQIATVEMTFSNPSITNNSFEYDVFVTNTGPSTMSLRGYSFGLIHALNMENGGTITHMYIPGSRDTILNTIPSVVVAYEASKRHLRATTVTASSGYEVPIFIGVPVKLGRFRVMTTTNWALNFDPNLQAQVITQAGYTQCLVGCIIGTPPLNTVIYGTGNPPSSSTINGLTANVNMSGLLLGVPCTGTPNAGTAISTQLSLCSGEIAMISLSGSTVASDLSYQWFRSGNGISFWVPLIGATNMTHYYAPPANSTSYYKCVVTCLNSGLSDTSTVSNVVTVQPYSITSFCFCPSSFNGSTNTDIGQLTIGGLINPTTAPLSQTSNINANGTYSDFTSLPMSQFSAGQTYPVNIKQITSAASLATSWVSIFIDLNQNANFIDSGEHIFSGASNGSNGFNPTGNITIPLSATIGQARMRVIISQGNNPVTNPCLFGVLGETEDYIIDIVPPCTAPNLNFATPNSGGNTGYVTLHIYGGCLDVGSSLQLIKGIDTISVSSSSITNFSGLHLQALVDLNNAVTGYYDVVVNVPGFPSQTLANSFHVVAGVLDNTEPFLLGPSNVRINTWTQLNVSCVNNGNVNSNGNIVWVAVPSNVDLKYVGTPYSPSSSTLVFDSIQNYMLVDSLFGSALAYKVYPIYLGTLGPNATKSLPFKIRSNTLQSFDLKAWCSNPFFQLSLGTNQADCLSDVATTISTTTVPSFIPPLASCLYSGMDTIYNNYINCVGCNNQPANWSWMFAEFMNDCNSQASYAILNSGISEMMNHLLSSSNSMAMSQLGTGCASAFWPPLPPKNKLINIVTSIDPNAKYGPTSYDTTANNYITSNGNLNYTITCENDSSATAAAQVVTILDTLDMNVYDLSTFQLGSIFIGDTIIPVPPGLKSYNVKVDLSNIGVYFVCDINASLNELTGIVSWVFTTLEQNTLFPATGAFDGFLLPNVVAPEGEAGVSFSIKLLNTVLLNTAINNQAFIYFDNNAPIATDTWHNTIDDVKPISSIQILPAYSDAQFVVNWSGNDMESGILNYDIYYAINGGAYQLLLQNTNLTSYQFTGVLNSSYSFYSVAMDKAGNQEEHPILADASTYTRDCNVVLQPTLDTMGNVTFCQGNSVTLTVNGGNFYAWNNSSNANSITVNASGNYSVIVSDTFLCSHLIDTTNVVVLPLPILSINASSNTLCVGQSTMLSANGAASYVWLPTNDMTTTIMQTPASSTLYHLIGTDANGCVNYDSIQIIVNPLPSIAIAASTLSICSGDALTLTGSGGVSYQWLPTNDITSSILQTPTVNTQYILNGTDINNCSNADTIDITVMPLPTDPIITPNGSSLNSNYPTGNQWYLNNTAIPGANSTSYTPLVNGDYSVEYTDAFGCSSISGVFNFNAVGISDNKRITTVFAFPNPTSGILQIEGYHIEDELVDLYLYNIQGQILRRDVIKSANLSFQKQINISNLSNGIYTLILKTNSWNRIMKVIKE